MPTPTDPLVRIVCAWCSSELRAGPTGGPVSHGICVTCGAELEGLAIEDVAAMSREAADRLPWGRVRLRGSGEIVEYNRAEAALSGRRPESVIGRHFFLEVAPCTHVKDFEGRLAAMRAAKVNDRAEFDFVFRFPEGAVRVSIRMIHLADADETIMLVRKSR